ncbi:MAG: response regulator [Bacteroidota bacterium]|nr:response regulator [Bacteroidota bacterium]
MNRELIDIGYVIKHAVLNVQRSLGDDDHIDLDLPQDTIHIYGDSDPLTRAFTALFGNNIGRSGGKVNVNAKVDQSTKLIVEVIHQISDISTRQKIPDDPLNSLDRSQIEKIVQEHGGNIRTIGEDSVLVDLPLAVVSRRSQNHTMEDNSKCKVLVVDDNVDGAVTLSVILKHMGNSVRITHDGNSALAVGAEFIPDLILMDIGMPGMDGYETCERMRSQEWSANVRIVALTGWGQEEDKRKARRAGFDLHLVKPVDRKTLMEVIATTREGRTMDGEPSPGRM